MKSTNFLGIALKAQSRCSDDLPFYSADLIQKHVIMKLSILTFLLYFQFSTSEVSNECKQRFMSYKHPFVCCKYPMRKILLLDEENCKAKCLDAGENHDCCLLDCTYRETGVVVQGIFNDQALIRLYENFLKDNGAGKYDAWMPVIEKSVRKCMETMPNTGEIYSCKIPEYAIDVIDCVNLMNYLNCPTFERSESCVKAQDFIRSLDTCGRYRNGTLLINHEYWDFRTINRNVL